MACPKCGGVLILKDGKLICPNPECEHIARHTNDKPNEPPEAPQSKSDRV